MQDFCFYNMKDHYILLYLVDKYSGEDLMV